MRDYEIEKNEVLEANVAYHSALARNYDAKQPHFRAENVARVDKILSDMAADTHGGSLVDLGCGTGFIMNIAKKYFRLVVGVDITPEMLKLVDTTGGQVELCLADTDNLPFPDNRFDVCTAYGFLHHLYDLRPTLSEACRCLRPGGLFFADQEPNYYYWWLMSSLNGRGDLPEVVRREVESVVAISEGIASETGLSPEDVSLAEFQKINKGGFDADMVVSIMQAMGFCSVKYRYEWFLGQGRVLHDQSASNLQAIEDFLRQSLPATRHLFKYLSFFAKKKTGVRQS